MTMQEKAELQRRKEYIENTLVNLGDAYDDKKDLEPLSEEEQDIYNVIHGMSQSLHWTSYSWENKSSHPPKPGKYLIYRKKCDKMHYEMWNGSGWSSSNIDCTDWCDPKKP